MKTKLILSGVSIFILILSSNLNAASVFGVVNFVGTIKEYKPNDNTFGSQFRLRVTGSTCKTPPGTPNDTAEKKTRWIVVRSGRMDGKFVHNMANFRNAYNTIITAFLTNNIVQIDNVPSCNADLTQTINLWASSIAIYRGSVPFTPSTGSTGSTSSTGSTQNPCPGNQFCCAELPDGSCMPGECRASSQHCN